MFITSILSSLKNTFWDDDLKRNKLSFSETGYCMVAHPWKFTHGCLRSEFLCICAKLASHLQVGLVTVKATDGKGASPDPLI